jgi:hypothetical protein
MSIDSAPPTLLPSRWTVYGMGQGYSATFDTRIPETTTGPWGTSLQEPGDWSFAFKSVSFPLACNFPTDSAIITKSLTAMICKPEWFLDPTNVYNFHAQLGDVTIALPNGFATAHDPAVAAAADWALALGRTITVLDNSTCAADDPHCVELAADHGTNPGDPVGCASFGPSDLNVFGEWTGFTRIRFEPQWQGADPDLLRRHIAHELGHYFGLKNREDSSCGPNDTLMGPVIANSCYQSSPISTQPLGPSATDVASLQKSTYGNQSRRVCGW